MPRLNPLLQWIKIFQRTLSTKNLNSYYAIAIALIIALHICGFVATFLIFAAPRNFRGDFYSAMYDPKWWDGSGLIYGPLFVMKRWLVNAFPEIFSIQFFGFFSIFLILFSLIICLIVTNRSRAGTLICLSVWTLNSFYYYSFSVAAIPELIELLMLMVVWWGFSAKRYIIAAIALTLAVLTKLVPIVLAPLVLIFFSWTGLISAITIGTSLFLLVSIGQNQTFSSSISQFLETKSAEPQPTSEQFLGMSSALARILGLEPNSNFLLVNRLALIAAVTIYFLILLISFKVSKVDLLIEHRVRVAFLFILYLGLLPFLHLNAAHRHTFIFLAPVFVGFAFILSYDDNLERVSKFKKCLIIEFFLYSFTPLFTLDVFNFDGFLGVQLGEDLLTTFLYISEPIWINLILVATLLLYAKTKFLTKDHGLGVPMPKQH
jgi:hypothetical protein